MDWCQRNQLVGDPFDRISGLEGIETTSLIVETEIFKKYSNMLEASRNLLGRSIIIFGEFGSGRTTLFMYLKNHFNKGGIQSFIIRLHGVFQDSTEIEQMFISSFFFKLTNRSNDKISLHELVEELRIKKEKNKINRYFIFIDELHKNQMTQSSLQFLKDLQGIIEELSEDIGIGIMIAGRNDWKDTLINDPIYSGTFGSYDEIGDMTLDDVYDMIDKRVRHFHRNPECYNSFSLITKEAIAKIYSEAELKTPRSILRATSRLIQEVPESVDIITPSVIHRFICKDTLNDIKRLFLSSSTTHSRLSKLCESFDPLKQKAMLKLLCDFYNSPLKLPLKSSSGYDAKLVREMLKMNLLQKRWVNVPIEFDHVHIKSTIGGEEIITVDDVIKNLFDNINEKYHAPPDDYLHSIYSSNGTLINTNYDTEKGEIKHIESIKERLPARLIICNSWIDKAIALYKKVSEFETSGISIDKEGDFVIACESSMDSILHVYYAIREDDYDATDVRVPSDKLLAMILRDCDLEELSEFYQKIRLLKSSKHISSENKDVIFELFFRSYHKVVEITLGELGLGRFLALKSDSFPQAEMETLREIRSMIFDRVNYKAARILIRELLKSKVAESIDFNLTIMYGDDWQKWLPTELSNKLKVTDLRDSSNVPKIWANQEIYKALFRLELGDVYDIVENKRFWDGVFSYIFKGYGKIKLGNIFNKIDKALNIPDGDLKNADIIDLFGYVLKVITLINSASSFYLNKANIINLQSSDPEYIRIVFGDMQMEKTDIKIKITDIESGERDIKSHLYNNQIKVKRPRTPLQIGILGYFVMNDKITFFRYEGDELIFNIGEKFAQISYRHMFKSRGAKCELTIQNPKHNELLISFSKPSAILRYPPDLISLDETKIDGMFNEMDTLWVNSSGLVEYHDFSGKASMKSPSYPGNFEENLKKYNQSLVSLGSAVYKLVFCSEVRCDIESCDIPIILSIDEKLIIYPWELMYDGKEFLALKAITGRAIIPSKRRTIQPPTREWKRDGKIRFLLIGVSNPKEGEELKWVRIEIEKLKEMLKKLQYIDIDVLLDNDATNTEVINKLGDDYDFIHFAGHVFFNDDETKPENNGILLYDSVLEAREIKNIIKNTPCLVFLNACSSVKLERRQSKERYANYVQNISMAFIEKGSSVVGSVWPIDDEPATEFCIEFYQKLFEGNITGEAMRGAKKKIYEKMKGNLTWASYILYGDPCGYIDTTTI